jgi:hypothetical protein
VTGQIVLISGTSGSGKTTTCAQWARRAPESWLMFGMDLLAGTLLPAKYTMFGEKKDEGYFPQPLWPGLHGCALGNARDDRGGGEERAEHGGRSPDVL